jgi:hypothetical protein
MVQSMTATASAPLLVPLSGLRDLVTEVMHKREYLATVPPGLTLQHFLDAISTLPDPAPVSQAVSTIVGVLRDRGFRHLLLPGIIAGCDARWPGPAENAAVAVPDFALRCQWCSAPIPPERGPAARYCRNSHRVSAHRAKKRAEQRSANEVASGGR